jgi:hypothetical protein
MDVQAARRSPAGSKTIRVGPWIDPGWPGPSQGTGPSSQDCPPGLPTADAGPARVLKKPMQTGVQTPAGPDGTAGAPSYARSAVQTTRCWHRSRSSGGGSDGGGGSSRHVVLGGGWGQVGWAGLAVVALEARRMLDMLVMLVEDFEDVVQDVDGSLPAGPTWGRGWLGVERGMEGAGGE